MKDIDFDELDKAVNSLMATTPGLGVPGSPTQQSQAAQPNVTPQSSAPATVAPAITPAPVAAPAAPIPTLSPAASSTVTNEPTAPVTVRSTPVAPAARRSGRFMDMVHSSSEMKPRVETPAPSREGLTITPRPATVPEPTVDELETIVPPDNQGASSVKMSTAQAMPDPIDMTPAEVEVPPAVKSIDTVEATQPSQPDVMTLGSVESPFLSDAKVEKRPLNAGVLDAPLDLMQDDKPIETQVESSNTETLIDSDEQNGDHEPTLPPQVPELSSDLVAIESNEAAEVTQAVETTDVATQVDAPTVPLGPASISQQYKAQPSTGDKSHAAIYDASQYPEPLTHPAKSKSGWLWVLWVVLLLGVGAGGAFLLYNLGIIP